VSLLANVEYVIAICHQFVDEVMGHGNIGTGGVDTVEAVFPCPTPDKRRYAVCCEDHCSLVNLFQYTCAVGPFEGNHAEIGQFFNGVAAIHKLSNNVDWSRGGRGFFCLPYHWCRGEAPPSAAAGGAFISFAWCLKIVTN